MDAPTPAHRDTPTTPADLDGASRRHLLDSLTAHEGALVDARHGIGDPLPPDRLAGHALDALACARALATAALRWEWLAQLEALQHGATLGDVAAASGLTPDEVVAGLRSRIAAQVEHAGMPRDEADRLLALVDRAEIVRRLFERHGDHR